MSLETPATGVYAVPITAPALEPATLVPQDLPTAERHPVSVYLASLSASGRPTMLGALEICAQHLTSSRMTAHNLPWHQLRYQHLNALRANLAEIYAPATANRYLTAVRCVLKECWRLD